MKLIGNSLIPKSKNVDASCTVYSLLGSLVQGRLAMKLFDNFFVNSQPKARNRANLQQGIMAYPNFNMKLSILPQDPEAGRTLCTV